MVHPLLGDITNEIIDFIYTQIKSHKNKKKIKHITNTVMDLVFIDIKPYLYTIVTILVILFLINCFNFYYYIKLVIKLNPEVNMTDAF